MVKCECNSSHHYVFHYLYCLVYSMLNFLLIVIFINHICIIFIVCSVTVIVCGAVYVVFRLGVVIYFGDVLFVCCVLLQYHCHRIKTHLQLK
jgi:hypothetical protein